MGRCKILPEVYSECHLVVFIPGFKSGGILCLKVRTGLLKYMSIPITTFIQTFTFFNSLLEIHVILDHLGVIKTVGSIADSWIRISRAP